MLLFVKHAGLCIISEWSGLATYVFAIFVLLSKHKFIPFGFNLRRNKTTSAENRIKNSTLNFISM